MWPERVPRSKRHQASQIYKNRNHHCWASIQGHYQHLDTKFTVVCQCIFQLIKSCHKSPVLTQDGVVLGADTRSTSDTTVADKNCEKIHYIAPNIYCCGAGTAADTENVTGVLYIFPAMLRAQDAELQALNLHRGSVS